MADISPRCGGVCFAMTHAKGVTVEGHDAAKTIGLCLSGGGFRAALFHLGALERLVEVGGYQRVSRIVGVSGGSFVAAWLALDHAKDLTGAPYTRGEWRTRITVPMVERLTVNRRWKSIVRRMLPTTWVDPSRVTKAFADDLATWLTPQVIDELPLTPTFVFGATDLRTARPLYFERLPFYPHDPDAHVRHGAVVQGTLPVAYAVAASAAFPGVLPPMAIAVQGPTATGHRHELFVDGGLYDNVGIGGLIGKADTLLISDGGGRPNADWQPSGRFTRLKTLKRIVDIPDSQIRNLQRSAIQERSEHGGPVTVPWSIERHRWLTGDARRNADNAEMFGQIGIVAEEELSGTSDRATYMRDTAAAIAAIRTDADAFSAWEVAFLLNHGYYECAEALQVGRDHLPLGVDVDTQISPPCLSAAIGESEFAVSYVLGDSEAIGALGRPYRAKDIRTRARRKFRSRPHTYSQVLASVEDLVLRELSVETETEAQRWSDEFKRRIAEVDTARPD